MWNRKNIRAAGVVVSLVLLSSSATAAPAANLDLLDPTKQYCEFMKAHYGGAYNAAKEAYNPTAETLAAADKSRNNILKRAEHPFVPRFLSFVTKYRDLSQGMSVESDLNALGKLQKALNWDEARKGLGIILLDAGIGNPYFQMPFGSSETPQTLHEFLTKGKFEFVTPKDAPAHLKVEIGVLNEEQLTVDVKPDFSSLPPLPLEVDFLIERFLEDKLDACIDLLELTKAGSHTIPWDDLKSIGSRIKTGISVPVVEAKKPSIPAIIQTPKGKKSGSAGKAE